MQYAYVCYFILAVATVAALFTLPPLVRCWHYQYAFDVEHNISSQKSKFKKALEAFFETLGLAPIAAYIAACSLFLIILILKNL
ncbi:MAG: hypothetical protein DI628_03700 [Blastochloris viridis]|uniref:Uncharacterized protein n=1 Tax=Blastochloris viridis TaxID=1079 RepID=A0A6N4RER6_BLAVI|nr:MAG: hypothetical protein DI628_03700 [Blastochloris viridis]